MVWNGGKGHGLADVVERYVKKGEKIYVEGEIEYRQWQDKDNQTRYTTEIRVRELMLLGGRPGGDDMEGGGPVGRRPRPARSKAAGAGRQARRATTSRIFRSVGRRGRRPAVLMRPGRPRGRCLRGRVPEMRGNGPAA